MIEEEYVYVLLSDGDQTTRSTETPFGVAVDNEEEAKRFAREDRYHDYKKLRVFKDKDEAVHWAFHTPEGRANL